MKKKSPKHLGHFPSNYPKPRGGGGGGIASHADPLRVVFVIRNGDGGPVGHLVKTHGVVRTVHRLKDGLASYIAFSHRLAPFLCSICPSTSNQASSGRPFRIKILMLSSSTRVSGQRRRTPHYDQQWCAWNSSTSATVYLPVPSLSSQAKDTPPSQMSLPRNMLR